VLFSKAASCVAFNGSYGIFIEATIKNDNVLASVVAIIAGEIDFQSPSHVPANASFLDIFRLMSDRLFYLSSLRHDLLFAEAHSCP